MRTVQLAGSLVAAFAAAAVADEVTWTVTGPGQVPAGSPVTWQAAVTVTGSNQGLAGYAFHIVVGPSPGPTAGPDEQWGTADDENVSDVQLSVADWVPSFRVQGTPSPNPGTVKDTGNMGGPGLNILPSAGTNTIRNGELLQVGAGLLDWTPFVPPSQDGQTAGVGLAARKAVLLADPSGEYVLHSGTIPTAGLAPGAYTVLLVPVRSRVLRGDLDLSQPQSGFLMMAANGVGDSFEFVVTPATVPADFDADGDVDLNDFAHFQICFNGAARPPAAEGCADADFDHDQDADLNDFAVFQLCFNGASRPPACQP